MAVEHCNATSLCWLSGGGREGGGSKVTERDEGVAAAAAATTAADAPDTTRMRAMDGWAVGRSDGQIYIEIDRATDKQTVGRPPLRCACLPASEYLVDCIGANSDTLLILIFSRSVLRCSRRLSLV